MLWSVGITIPRFPGVPHKVSQNSFAQQVAPDLAPQHATGPSTRPVSLVATVLCLALCALALAVPLAPRPDIVADFSLTAAMLAILAVFVALRARQGRLDYFEVFIPLSLIYLAYFGWSTLYLKLSPGALAYRSLEPWLTPALALCFLGFLAFALGYNSVFRHARPSWLSRWAPVNVTCILVLGVVGFVGQASNMLQGRLVGSGQGVSAVLSIGQQLAPLFYFAWFLMWYVVWRRGFRRAQLVVLLATFMPMALGVMFMLMGGKKRAIVILALPAIAFWYARGRLPLKTVVAVVLLGIFLVFPLYDTYRMQDTRADKWRRLDTAVDTAIEWDRSTFVENSFGRFMDRIAIITSVAAVLRDVGDHVEFRKGETLLLTPLGMFIPRFLWPDKPSVSLGREFGVTFQLVSPIDSKTMIAPSFIAEFYWNFHIPGVLVGMFVFGAFFRWVYRSFGEFRGYDPIGKATYAMLLVRMVHFEGNVAMMLSVLVRSVVLVAVALLLLKRLGLMGRLEQEPDAAA